MSLEAHADLHASSILKRSKLKTDSVDTARELGQGLGQVPVSRCHIELTIEMLQ